MKNKQFVYRLRKGCFYFLFLSMGGYPLSMLASPSYVVEQQVGKTVTGSVTDNMGPLAGVSIVVKGTTNGTVTDVDGNYSIEVPTGSVLQFSYIGYNMKEIVVGNQTHIDVKMSEDNQLLDEVVVIGYGTQKKVNLTGAVSSVKGEVLNERTFNNSTTALQGMAPGLTIIDKGGEPGNESSSINIRGIGTLGKSNPLILVDNVPVSSMNDVLPQDIESVSILKDAASASIYGSRAANGVILVTTKRGSDKN